MKKIVRAARSMLHGRKDASMYGKEVPLRTLRVDALVEAATKLRLHPLRQRLYSACSLNPRALSMENEKILLVPVVVPSVELLYDISVEVATIIALSPVSEGKLKCAEPLRCEMSYSALTHRLELPCSVVVSAQLHKCYERCDEITYAIREPERMMQLCAGKHEITTVAIGNVGFGRIH